MNFLKKSIFLFCVFLSSISTEIKPALSPDHKQAIIIACSAFVFPMMSIPIMLNFTKWLTKREALAAAAKLMVFPELKETPVFSKEEQLFNETIIDRIKNNLPIPKTGLLFYGNPGNGKTLTINYIANQSNSNIMLIRPSDLCKPPMGGGAHAMMVPPALSLRIYFEFAINYQKTSGKPLIIFLDEIDFAGLKRMNISQFELKTLAAELLLQTELAGKNKGIYLAGATNYFDYLDSALKRPGRLGNHVYLKNPDLKTIHSMISFYANGFKNSEKINLIAEKAVGLSKSSIVDSLREAAIITSQSLINSNQSLKEMISCAISKNQDLFFNKLEMLFEKDVLIKKEANLKKLNKEIKKAKHLKMLAE
jgi:SpoVK/Ycf46/Vps4 family AAA+-type ATPase